MKKILINSLLSYFFEGFLIIKSLEESIGNEILGPWLSAKILQSPFPKNVFVYGPRKIFDKVVDFYFYVFVR